MERVVDLVFKVIEDFQVNVGFQDSLEIKVTLDCQELDFQDPRGQKGTLVFQDQVESQESLANQVRMAYLVAQEHLVKKVNLAGVFLVLRVLQVYQECQDFQGKRVILECQGFLEQKDVLGHLDLKDLKVTLDHLESMVH